MADSKYCRMCHGPCNDCGVCLVDPNHFKPTNDMIQNALKMKDAFSTSTFRKYPNILPLPVILVTDGENGGATVDVRLTWKPFNPRYRDPRSPQRRELERAAREEIIRSFDLPRDRVRDGDIEVDIRGLGGSVQILLSVNASIIANAAGTIAGLCNVGRSARAPGANVSENRLPGINLPITPIPQSPILPLLGGDLVRDVTIMGGAVSGFAFGATAGTVAGPVGMVVGGAIGYLAGGKGGDFIAGLLGRPPNY